MKRLLFVLCISLWLLSGCAGSGIANYPPPNPGTVGHETYVCKGDYLKTGWFCAEVMKRPTWVHPLLYTYQACDVNLFDEKGNMSQTWVFYSGSEQNMRNQLSYALQGHGLGGSSTGREAPDRLVNLINTKKGDYFECRNY